MELNNEEFRMPRHESFDQFIKRMYPGQRGTPFHLDYTIPSSNYKLPYTRRNDPENDKPVLEGVTFHVNCKCSIEPPTKTREGQLQEELAFAESLLILQKIVGYDVRMN